MNLTSNVCAKKWKVIELKKFFRKAHEVLDMDPNKLRNYLKEGDRRTFLMMFYQLSARKGLKVTEKSVKHLIDLES